MSRVNHLIVALLVGVFSTACGTEPPAEVQASEVHASELQPLAETAQPAQTAQPEAVPSFCTHPRNCVQFCDCDYADCIAQGISQAQCRSDQTMCFHDC